jgi:ABC-type dipeptide/oligopeptide/nickel transport system permease subunit
MSAPPSSSAPRETEPFLPQQPLRRFGPRPPGLEVWVGAGLLAAYVAVALSALIEFRGSLSTLATNPAWVPPFSPIGPSWAHPFGVLNGLGTDLFTAVWQATPWDLAIVFSILGMDAVLGIFLGALAGLRPGGRLDVVVTFLGDSLGAIPAVFLVIVLFAGVAVVAPYYANLELFVLLFGIVLWPACARTVRERVRTIAQEPYVEAARASGAGGFRLLTRHILPYSLGPVLAQIPLDFGAIFFVLSVFTWFFNCQGPPAPSNPLKSINLYPIPVLPPFSPLPAVNFPEWGNLLGLGACWGFTGSSATMYWWMIVFPLIAILGLGLAIGLLCDGIDKWLRLQA